MMTRGEMAKAAWSRHRRPFKDAATSRTPSKYEAVGTMQREFCREAVDRATPSVPWWLPVYFAERRIIRAVIAELEKDDEENDEEDET